MGKIILPSRGIITPARMHCALAGRYRLTTEKIKSGTRKDTGWFDNLITDAGLYNIGNFGNGNTDPAIQSYMAVGTGNTAPQYSDTSLQSQIATVYRSSVSSKYVAASGPTPPYWSSTFSYTFPTGVAAGNISEVGAYPQTVTNWGISSRALVVDSNGNPTTITVLSDEILTATYELRCYLDTSDHAFSFLYNGAQVTGVYRLDAITTAVPLVGRTIFVGGQLWGLSVNEIGAVTDSQITTTWQDSGSTIQVVNDMANSGTWYWDFMATFTTWNGTIKSFVANAGMWKYKFGQLSTPITKTTGQTLQASFRHSWGRYTG